MGIGNDPVSRTHPDGGFDWVQKNGKMVYDSRVIEQGSARTLYGDETIFRKNGYEYMASNGACIELGDYGYFKRDDIIFSSADLAANALKDINAQISAITLTLGTIRKVRAAHVVDALSRC